MLSTLIRVPKTATDWLSWSFSHRDAHDRIRLAIRQKGGPNLPDYVIDPIPPNDLQGWLRRNQELHVDFNAVLGTQSSDLTALDPGDEASLSEWVQTEYLELYDALAALGVANV